MTKNNSTTHTASQKLNLVVLILFAVLVFIWSARTVFAQTNSEVSYIPLIGITAVPEPLALPSGAGDVTYHYAVKNFLEEIPLTNIEVTDDKCSTIEFTTGDDNNDNQLDYSETWRYTCTVNLSATTQSIATATGTANDTTATHRAYSTVVVGSDKLPPLVSIINITKVAYPLSLPAEGGDITFTYKVNNPGSVPLKDVSVVDDKCSAISSRLGDTNGNNLLDTNEVWIYTCTTNLKETTTNTVVVTAFANDLKAMSDATITVVVKTPATSAPDLPAQSLPPGFSETEAGFNLKIIVWAILLFILAVLITLFILITRKSLISGKKKKEKITVIVMVIIFIMLLTAVSYLQWSQQLNKEKHEDVLLPDKLFGWKFPVTRFPDVGADDSKLAYSDIRDPGGIPQGLPVRLKIPVIGVDSAIEDALITPEGRMDVPAGSKNVAWFALGPQPGQRGSAVIGGHFGISNNIPFVFYNLDKIKIGDKVYIINDKGETLSFIVRAIESFDRDADATTVFTSEDGLAHLNLITCEGIWNQVNGTYPTRLVIFTDAVPTENTAESTVSFPRTLSIGDRGADVVALQTILQQQGLLIIPAGVAKGYFGALTKAAVTKYQASVGLSTNGVFNSLTRAKLVSTENTTEFSVSFPRTLSLGDQGADVVALQTILQQQGLLVIPAGIAKGYFGPLTKAAVTKYQASVGLSTNGVFDSLTRARLAPEESLVAIKPKLPLTALETLAPSRLYETFIQSTRKLYATPADGLITSLLLLSIISMAFQILKHFKTKKPKKLS